MYDDDDIESNVQKTKFLSGIGCLLWTLILTILIVTPIAYYGGKFIYDMKFKENTLVVSKSPNQLHRIEVVEVGGPVFFGPSKVRIKYENHYIDRSIGNDGATLQPSNVSVNWENDQEAIITLDGHEQDPEIEEFKLESDKNTNPFKVVH